MLKKPTGLWVLVLDAFRFLVAMLLSCGVTYIWFLWWRLSLSTTCSRAYFQWRPRLLDHWFHVEIVNNDRLNYRRAILRARDVKPSGGSRDVKPILLCLFLVFVSGIGSGIGSHLGIADRIADSPLSPQAPLDANRSGKIGCVHL